MLAAQQPILADLNPDRMWPVYRRYHLLIVGQRDDERSGALTAAVVEVLSRHLPASRPQLVSAADARRIGVLIATDQQDVAIMQAERNAGEYGSRTEGFRDGIAGEEDGHDLSWLRV